MHWWRGEDSNLRRQSRQIYSLIPLTAREPLRMKAIFFYQVQKVKKNLNYKKKPVKYVKWCWHQESNPGPTDYKSVALPAELCQLDIKKKPGDNLLSHGETPHYHRRSFVSLLSSRWDQVGQNGYRRQAKLV